MKKEFNLSEKRNEFISNDKYFYFEEDVKEFIRRLKEEIENQEYKDNITETLDEILEKIDKLAGEI